MARRAAAPLPPLPEGLLAAVHAFVAAEGLPTGADAWAEGTASLSAAYNAAQFPVAWSPAREAARLAFFLPRDARKVEAALRDLPLPTGDALSVLDLGAGAGASAIGALLALRSAGHRGPVAVHLVEPEAAALARATRLLGALRAALGPLSVHPTPGDLTAAAGRHHLIVLGQVLVEVGHGSPEPARVALHARLLGRLVAQHLHPDGLLVAVEPALKATARRLQAARQALLDARAAAVVAPCPHDGACPLLVRPDDWCHEDLPVDLPPALQPIARAAGLRWQGLTYSRLALAPGPRPRPPARVVAPPAPSRGKHTLTFCFPGSLRAVDRLDRHATTANAAWAAAHRGDGLAWPGATEGRRPGPADAVQRAGGSPVDPRDETDDSNG